MKLIVITGAKGGLGKALINELSNEYKIHEIDKSNKSKFNILNINKKMNIVAIINCGAILKKKKIKNVKITDLKYHMDNNLYPSFFLLKKFEKNLIKNKSLFLNIGSIHANLTKKDFLPYAVSKSALVGLTKALAVEYMGKLSINILNLGPVNTPMLINNLNNKDIKLFIKSQPTKKIICPKQFAKFIKSLIVNRDLSFTGSVINYDNGYNSLLKDE
jgi:NAD(P)-dependent dehydrogenase (short-subunit alcohol dehydrogenase family)